jgi:hypothetical protein
MALSLTRTSRLAGTLALAMGVAVAFGACSSSSSTQAPNNGGNPSQSQPTQAAGAATPAVGAGGVADAVSKLSDIKSFRFTMTMKGGSYGSLLGSEPMTGIIISSPEKASDVTMMGMEVIEVGGKTYTNIGVGGWIQSKDSSASSTADSLSPEKMLGAYVSPDMASGYKSVGDEQKNGVATSHFTADSSAMAEYGSLVGVTGGTWTADVWIAKDGGYPVSVKIGVTGGSSDFEFSMDITNVNDPANKITAPI